MDEKPGGSNLACEQPAFTQYSTWPTELLAGRPLRFESALGSTPLVFQWKRNVLGTSSEEPPNGRPYRDSMVRRTLAFIANYQDRGFNMHANMRFPPAAPVTLAEFS